MQNPFLHRRETHRQSTPEKPTQKLHIGISGRANSAPGWIQDRQLSIDSSLEAVREVVAGVENQKVTNNGKSKEKR